MSKKVFVFLAEGFEEIEALTPVDLLRRAGIVCTTVSIGDSLEVIGSHGIKVVADRFFDEAECMKGDAVILPGGMPGTINLSKHYGVKNVVIDYNKRNKLIASICAAPTILGEMGLLEGLKSTCYPGMENKLYGSDVIDEVYVKDGNFLTSKGVGTAIDFALKIIEILEDDNLKENIKTQIVY
ncbi:DJ-1 family protein [Tyzzerella sp. An114]|uniref:DJ-1 family glyoxalase III n=1 Tax=Tyzzerella sp. An114 TaxID=1965545 RepID=UPI000B4530F2|nr:DJ-1 family glyoxalase III [Tyzzerella sp. An114]OUQ58816.1 DJ-1 family protein [Tyzzerella sp. An114]